MDLKLYALTLNGMFSGGHHKPPIEDTFQCQMHNILVKKPNTPIG